MSNRPPFSFDRPFVTGNELVYGETRYVTGAVFPWRDLGISEQGIWDLWRTFHVHNLPETVAPAASLGAAPVSLVPTGPRVTSAPAPSMRLPPRR